MNHSQWLTIGDESTGNSINDIDFQGNHFIKQQSTYKNFTLSKENTCIIVGHQQNVVPVIKINLILWTAY